MVLSAAFHLTLHDLEERLSERLVEERVEERVDHGGGVAQPGHQVDHFALNVRPAGDENVGDEERGPQEDEREEHDPQNLGGFLLHPDVPSVSLGRHVLDGGGARPLSPEPAGGRGQRPHRRRVGRSCLVQQRRDLTPGPEGRPGDEVRGGSWWASALVPR